MPCFDRVGSCAKNKKKTKLKHFLPTFSQQKEGAGQGRAGGRPKVASGNWLPALPIKAKLAAAAVAAVVAVKAKAKAKACVRAKSKCLQKWRRCFFFLPQPKSMQCNYHNHYGCLFVRSSYTAGGAEEGTARGSSIK